MSKHRVDTLLIHAGDPKPRICGAATVPIFQSSVFEHQDGETYHDIRYPRLSNLPNHVAIQKKLAELEGAEDALVAASGMAAISAALFGVLGRDGHVLVQDCIYGGTHNLLTDDFSNFQLSYDFIDARDPASWQSKIKPNTRAIYVEALTNPLVQVIDHKKVVAFAKENNLVSLIDNTFASPINYRPIENGYDLSLHSATKYLNGHSDLVAGAVIGSREHVRTAKHRLDHLGGSLDAHACFLLNRGLATLALRVRQQNENAMSLALFLQQQPKVTAVHYPGLESHPDHTLAKENFSGFSGMLSLEITGGEKAAREMIDRLELPIYAPSLGGVESLITLPARSSHGGMSPEHRSKLGITDGLMRVSVGIEHIDDLVDDFAQALAS